MSVTRWLRDRLREDKALSKQTRIDLVSDSTGRGIRPRVTLQEITDPRGYDLDGDDGVRETMIQLDLFADQASQADPIAARLEEMLADEPAWIGKPISGDLGTRVIAGLEIVDRRGQPPATDEQTEQVVDRRTFDLKIISVQGGT